MHRELVTVVGEDGRVVCARCVVADRPRARMRGLLGRRQIAQHEGILLTPTSSVHTFFMRFPIDVVFIDRDFVVTRVVHNLRTWRTAHAKGARAALELPAGAAARVAIREGEQLALDRVRKKGGALRKLGRVVARTSTIACVAVLAFTASALVGPADTANTQAPRPPEIAFRTSIATMAALAQPDTPLRVVVPQISPSALRTALDVLRVTKHIPSRKPTARCRPRMRSRCCASRGC